MEGIKELLTRQFSGPVTVEMILASVVFSFLISLFIVLVYRKSFTGIVYNRTLSMTVVLLSMVTAMIIRTINSNLSLSLGMVGALSIVRFRTAVKEPVDTAFLFWAITTGIMCGAGLYVIAVVAALCVGVAYYLMYMFGKNAKSQYLLVVIYRAEIDGQIDDALKAVSKKKLKSKSINANKVVELTYEIEYSKNTEKLLSGIQAIEGVRNVNLVTYNNDFGL